MIGPGFRAVAIDYDGTLADAARPSDDTLRAVRDLREQGTLCLLVTGRILAELREDFPDFEEHFDAVVGENGAVLMRPGHAPRVLNGEVPKEFADQLGELGVPLRRGLAIVATGIAHDRIVLEVTAQLGLELQVERNRGALMVLPAGVTKGTGVVEALAELNVSPHDAIAIGDAENDHALLAACEVGVATGNAIHSLKEHADVVLPGADGDGVARLLRGEGPPLVSTRRAVLLGTFGDGGRATLPTAGVSVGVYGEPGSGKSYIAGLIGEQLVAQRYVVCVIDFEGDHVGLGALHGAVTVGGREMLPDTGEIVRLLTHGFMSVVVDLSLHEEQERLEVAQRLLAALKEAREKVGLPHWIILEEAHVAPDIARPAHDSRLGLCLVTYRPEELEAAAQADYVVVMSDREGPLLRERGRDAPRRFMPAERSTAHRRHWHKYMEGTMPVHRRFYFRDGRGLTGRTAANLPQFVDEIAAAPDEVLRHHAAGGDFSRWIADICHDLRVARAVELVESEIAADGRDAGTMARLRERLVETAAPTYAPVE